jgi:ectoine hydroxylase-related dioxygenase (phytanoyl-CoA dioxygenase family)
MTSPGYEIRDLGLPDLALPRRRSPAGARHLLSDPAVAAFARRDDLLAIAREWLAPAAVPFRATLFDKSARRNWLVVWHQDTALPLESRFDSADWGTWSMKAGVHYAHAPAWALEKVVALRVHLDDSGPDNGPLRVIPGSHELGVLSDADVHRIARESTAVDCIAPRGSLLVMRPLLIHCSSKARNDSPRRVLHIEYAASRDLAPGIRLACC